MATQQERFEQARTKVEEVAAKNPEFKTLKEKVDGLKFSEQQMVAILLTLDIAQDKDKGQYHDITSRCMDLCRMLAIYDTLELMKREPLSKSQLEFAKAKSVKNIMKLREQLANLVDVL